MISKLDEALTKRSVTTFRLILYFTCEKLIKSIEELLIKNESLTNDSKEEANDDLNDDCLKDDSESKQND